MKRKRGLLILWTFHFCEWSVDVFLLISIFISLNKKIEFYDIKKSKCIWTGLHECHFLSLYTVIYIFYHLVSSTGHSNGQHENTFTKTAKLWILWRINLQDSSHEISDPLTAKSFFFLIFFLVLISSPDESRNRWHQMQRTDAVITQQHAGFRGGDRRGTD